MSRNLPGAKVFENYIRGHGLVFAFSWFGGDHFWSRDVPAGSPEEGSPEEGTQQELIHDAL